MARPELGEVVLLVIHYSENESLPAGPKFHKIVHDINGLVNLEKHLGYDLHFRRFASGVWSPRLAVAIMDEIGWGFLVHRNNRLMISQDAERVVHKYIRDYPDLAEKINQALQAMRELKDKGGKND